MTILEFTRHSVDKMRQLNLLESEVYGMYINAVKCTVSETAQARKMSMNNHEIGSVYYSSGDYILVIKDLPLEKSKLLITIYKATTPKIYRKAY